MRERAHEERIDEAAVAVFLDGLTGMTPKAVAHHARALAQLVRGASVGATRPVAPTCPSARRRSRRPCGGCACSSSRSPKHVLRNLAGFC